jgi:hypothetical protein
VRHARPAALDRLEPLLERLRGLSVLKEKSRGTFYVKSHAFLHFHEDPAGLFADVRAADGVDFERLRVEEPAERDALLALVTARLRS